MTDRTVLIAMFTRLKADYSLKPSKEYGACEVLSIRASYTEEKDTGKSCVISTADYFCSGPTTQYYLNKAGQVIKIDM